MSGVQIDVDVKTSRSERDLEAINQSLRNIEKTTAKTSEALKGMFKALAVSAGSAVSLNALKNISSEFTELSNKIATVTGKTRELTEAQDKLFKIAEETRGSLQSTVTTFASFGRALKSTGASTDRILKATKTIQEAMALSGSSAESANAAIVQLGQGLSAGVLRGEELNSVLEQGSRVGKALADELGVTTGQLRIMAAEGKLTSSVVFNAILKQSQAINKEFKDLAPTLTQGTSQLDDSIKIYINELDKGLGLSNAMGLSTFNMSNQIRKAAENAFDLGVQINLAYNRLTGNVKSIAAPIGNIALELGKQFAKVLPKGFLSETLAGDVNDALRTFDDATGNWIQKYKKFKLIDLVTWDSDVEAAVKKLKRLSPTYWAGAGFDVPTLEKFFSTKNIKAYGQAFQELAVAIAGNNNSITDSLAEFAADTRASTLAALRYFGFLQNTLINIRPGQFQTLFKTLSELVRGFSGAQIKIYEFGKIIQTFTEDYLIVFGVALKDAFFKSFDIVARFAKGVVNAFKWAGGAIVNFLDEIKPVSSALEEFRAADEVDMMLDSAISHIEKLGDAVRAVPGKLNSAYQAIKSFSKKVIHEFFVIYDDVIGHSWWTDTIESVVNTSNTLWDRASKGLTKFARNSIDLFKNVFERSNNLSFKWSDIKSIDLSASNFKLPKLDTKSMSENLLTAFDSMKKHVATFFAAFPSIAKAAMVASAGIAVAILFPAGAVKTALITAILTSLATSGTLIAEQFGAALTGGSFVSEVGYNLGKAAGYFTNTIIKELPKLINALLGVVSSFTRGFLEELPLIGVAFKGLFTAVEGAGASGPLGLIGTIFFGAGLAKLLVALDIAKKPIEGMFDVFKNISTIIFGDSKGNRDGMLSKYFFGALGPTRALSMIGLALQYAGAFDSLFAHSQLLSYGVEGGLLYLALAGDKGLGGIKNLLGTKVIKPVADALKSISKNAMSGNKTLYDIFFGDTGTWAERASSAIKSVIDKISGKIVDAAAPYVEKGYDFIKTLFLGKDSSATITAIKASLTEIYNVMLAQVGKMRAAFSMINISSIFGGFTRGPGLKDYEKLMAKTFGTTSAHMSKAASMAEKIGGTNGLLGRMFLGRYGKVAIIGTILAIFSSVAFAAENSAVTQKSVFDDITSNWNNLKLQNPIAAVALQITAVTIPLILGALYVFRSQAIAAIGSVLDVSKIKSWSSAFIAGIRGIARNMKTIGLVAGAGGIGALIGYKTGGSEMAIIGGMLAVELAIAFKKTLFLMFARLGAVLFTALTAKIVAAIVATAVVGGALYIWFFGKKGEFWSEVSKAYDKLKELVGLGSDKKSITTGLSDQAEKFATSRNLGINYSLKDINTKSLTSGEKGKLNKLIGDLEKTIQESIIEEELTGRVSQDTRDQIYTLNKGLTRYSDKLASKSVPEVENFTKFLQDLKQRNPDTRAGEIKVSLEQVKLDLAYFINKSLIKATRLFATTQAGKADASKRLDQLKSEKDTRYNAKYRGFNSGEERLRDLDKLSKSIEFPSDVLETEIKKLKTQYVQSAKDLVNAESEIRFSFSQMGFEFKDLPESDPIKAKKLELERQLSAALQQAVDYDAAMKSITQFQNSLNGLQTNLSAIGVTFESNALFAGSQESFDQLKKLGDEAKYLAEQLKNTKNVAEQNAIILRINEIKTQTTIIKTEADLQSLERTQFKLKDIAGKVNSNVFSEESFKKLGDQAADAFYREYTQIFNEIERLKVRTAGDTGAQDYLAAASKKDKLFTQHQSIVKQIDALNLPDSDAVKKELTKRKDEIFKSYESAVKEFEQLKIKQTINPVTGVAQLGPDYLTQYQAIEDKRKALEAKIRAELSSGAGNIQAQRDVASSVGIDFNKLVSNRGVDSALSGLNKLQRKKEELDSAERRNDVSSVGKLTREIDLLTERLNEAPTSLQTFINTVQGLGQNIGVEELSIVSPATMKRLQEASAAVIELDKQMQKLGPNVSRSKFSEILATKLRAAKAAFDAYIETIYSTPEKVLQGLNRVGLSDNFEISLISKDQINKFLDIDKTVLKLQNELKDPANSARFKEIVSQLVEAQKKSKELKDTFASFNTRLDVVNKAFGLNLTAEEFSSLPDEIQITLSDKANKLVTVLEEFMKAPLQSLDIAKPKEQRSVDIDALSKAVFGIESSNKHFNSDGSLKYGRRPDGSTTDAVGIGQIRERYAPDYLKNAGIKFDGLEDAIRLIRQESVNRTASTAMLKTLLEKYGNNSELAALAYHSGPGAANKVVSRARKAGISDFNIDPMQFLDSYQVAAKDYITKIRKAGVSVQLDSPKEANSPSQTIDSIRIGQREIRQATIDSIRIGQREIRQATIDSRETVIKSGVKLKEELDKIPLMNLTDIVSSITQTFPALSDFSEYISRLSNNDLRELAATIADVNDVKRKYDAGLATAGDVKAATQVGQKIVTSKVGTYGIDLRLASKDIGVEIDQATMNMVSAANKRMIESLVEQIKQAKKAAESAPNDAQRIAAQQLVNAKVEQLDEAIKAASKDVGATSREAGKAFASSITDNFKSSLSSLLKGEKDFKEFSKSILDNFTSTVIDTFVQGLLDPFTGENNIVTRWLRNIGRSIFATANKDDKSTSLFGEGITKWFSGAFDSVKSFLGFGDSTQTNAVGSAVGAVAGVGGACGCDISSGLSKTAESITGAIATQTGEQSEIFGSIGGLFTKGLEGLGGMLTSAWNGLSGMFSGGGAFSGIGDSIGGWFSAIASFFSTGGFVSGPGSGTSDSIPAMLSDGEFVINAKSTKKYMPLLQALNAGSLPKFATGGLVGAAVMAAPVMAAIDTSSKETAAPVQQVFQISITGDISRQTRAEIQRMLPNIANGVNAYNREKR